MKPEALSKPGSSLCTAAPTDAHLRVNVLQPDALRLVRARLEPIAERSHVLVKRDTPPRECRASSMRPTDPFAGPRVDIAKRPPDEQHAQVLTNANPMGPPRGCSPESRCPPPRGWDSISNYIFCGGLGGFGFGGRKLQLHAESDEAPCHDDRTFLQVLLPLLGSRRIRKPPPRHY